MRYIYRELILETKINIKVDIKKIQLKLFIKLKLV